MLLTLASSLRHLIRVLSWEVIVSWLFKCKIEIFFKEKILCTLPLIFSRQVLNSDVNFEFGVGVTQPLPNFARLLRAWISVREVRSCFATSARVRPLTLANPFQTVKFFKS